MTNKCIFIDIKQVAEYTGISPSTIYKLTSSGQIPHYKPTGKLLFKREEILAWIEESRIESLTVKNK